MRFSVRVAGWEYTRVLGSRVEVRVRVAGRGGYTRVLGCRFEVRITVAERIHSSSGL